MVIKFGKTHAYRRIIQCVYVYIYKLNILGLLTVKRIINGPIVRLVHKAYNLVIEFRAVRHNRLKHRCAYVIIFSNEDSQIRNTGCNNKHCGQSSA